MSLSCIMFLPKSSASAYGNRHICEWQIQYHRIWAVPQTLVYKHYYLGAWLWACSWKDPWKSWRILHPFRQWAFPSILWVFTSSRFSSSNLAPSISPPFVKLWGGVRTPGLSYLLVWVDINRLAAAWSSLLGVPALGTVMSMVLIPLILRGSLMLWNNDELFLFCCQIYSTSRGVLCSARAKYCTRNFSLCRICWACSVVCLSISVPGDYGFETPLLWSGREAGRPCSDSHRKARELWSWPALVIPSTLKDRLLEGEVFRNVIVVNRGAESLNVNASSFFDNSSMRLDI